MRPSRREKRLVRDWNITEEMDRGVLYKKIKSTHTIAVEFHIYDNRVCRIYASDEDSRLDKELGGYFAGTNNVSINEAAAYLLKKMDFGILKKYIIKSYMDMDKAGLMYAILDVIRNEKKLEKYYKMLPNIGNISTGIRTATEGNIFHEHEADILEWFEECGFTHWKKRFARKIRGCRTPGEMRSAFYGKRFFDPMIIGFLKHRIGRLYGANNMQRR